jgi:peptide/nickel transport system substrate-binding protein
MNSWRFTVAAALALFALVACSQAPTAQPTTSPPQASNPTAVVQPTASASPQAGGKTATMLVGNWGNGLFDPAKSDDETLKYHRLISAFVVEGDGTGGGLTPGVAKSWEMSPDGTVWTLTSNSGITAHNGEEINIDDIWWSLESRYGDIGKERSTSERLYAPMLGTTAITEKVEKVGDTVVVTMTEPKFDWPFRHSSNGVDASAIVIPQDYWNEVGGSEGYEENPVGAGPFRLISHRPQQEVVLEAFEDYYFHPGNGFPEDRRAKVDGLTVQIVSEPSTRSAALQAGQADVIEANILMLGDINNAGGKVVYAKESSYAFVTTTNCWDPELWCYKKEVRQALEYAVDKQAIVDTLFGPEAAAVKGWTFVTPSSFGYVPGVTDPRPYDPEKAKELLAQAGYPDGQGIPPFNVHTWAAGDVPFMPEVAQILSDSWNQLGLRSEVVVGDSTSIRAAVVEQRIPGDLIVRTNEARYLGLGITRENYGDPPSYDGRVCDPPSVPECKELGTIVNEKMVAINPDMQALEKSFQEAYIAMREANWQWSPFYANLPWGLGPRVENYEPWTLVPYVTAIWTLELK